MGRNRQPLTEGGPTGPLAALLGRLSEAVCQPQSWSDFLNHLGEFGRFSSALIMIEDPQAVRPPRTYTLGADREIFEHFRDCVKELDPFPACGARPAVPSHRVVLLPSPPGHRPPASQGVAAFIWAAEAGSCSLAAWRSPANPPCSTAEVDLFDLLATGFGQALFAAHRWETTRCERNLALQVLDHLSVGVFVVDARLRVLLSTATARRVLSAGEGLMIRGDVLRASRPDDDVRLRHLVADTFDAAFRGQRARGGVIALARAPGVRPLAVSATADSDLCDPDEASPPDRIALLVSDGERAPILSNPDLRTLYELTPAEAELASLLGAGFSVEEAAGRRGISVGTARVQLKSVFAKTDTHRQSELVRLLASIPARRAEDVAPHARP